jgi:hypothetical protein
MVRLLPFVAFFILRAVAHATVPGPFAVPAACCEGEVQRALVQVLDVAAIRVVPARRWHARSRPVSVSHSPLETRAFPTRPTVSLSAAGPVPNAELTSPSGSRAPPWPARINSGGVIVSSATTPEDLSLAVGPLTFTHTHTHSLSLSPRLGEDGATASPGSPP